MGNYARLIISIACILIPVQFVSAADAYVPPYSAQYSDDEQSYIAASPVLKIGFRSSGKPIVYTTPEKKTAGIAPACMDLLERKTGLRFTYIAMSDDSDVSGSLKRGEFDAVVTFCGKKNPFEKGISVSPSMLSAAMVLIINNSLSYSDSSELKYVLKTGFDTAAAFIRKTNSECSIIYLNTNDLEACLSQIAEGKADATFLNTFTASYLLQKPKYKNLRVLPQISFTQYLSVAIDSQRNPLLNSIVEKTIRSFSESEMQNIALANTAGIRYEKTLGDTLFEYRIPLVLSFMLAAAVFFSIILINIQRERSSKKILAANKELEKANAELSILNQSKTELLSRVSHEIRTPVNAIEGLSFLGEQATQDEKLLQYFRKINASGKYLSGLINDILDMNKIDGGTIKLFNTSTPMNSIIEDIKTIICPLAEAKKISLVISAQNIKEAVICDKMRFEQILINLLTNAVKFTPQDGTIQFTIEQNDESEKIRTVCSVQDTGCGMSSEFIPKLFQPFSQENRNPTMYGTGTGLGLAISRMLARLMGGDITVASVEGKGSTFTASMLFDPCTPESIEKISMDNNTKNTDDSVLAGKQVLLAEDNEINTEVAVGLLERKGMSITAVPDGEAAVKAIRDGAPHSFDIILMDIRMPKLDGFEASRRIRSLPRKDAKNIPIIAMTADAFSDSIEKARANGMNDYITKPIDVEKLYVCLTKYLSTSLL